MEQQDLPKSTAAFPTVSLLTPTFNRRAFIPHLIEYIRHQTYPAERMEWLVYDDGTESIEDLLAPYMSSMRIRYFRSDEKMTIGAKRNALHAAARGDILINMDDDDYYPPDRVSHAIHMMRANPRANLCGSSKMFLYFMDDKSIWQFGPAPHPNHATFGTMGYRREYAQKTLCNPHIVHAEEIDFTRAYKETCVQLDAKKVMLVICHSANTVNKSQMRTQNPLMKKTPLKLRDFIANQKHREYYS